LLAVELTVKGSRIFPKLVFKFPHPVENCLRCVTGTGPALSFSLRRYELPRMFSVTAWCSGAATGDCRLTGASRDRLQMAGTTRSRSSLTAAVRQLGSRVEGQLSDSAANSQSRPLPVVQAPRKLSRQRPVSGYSRRSSTSALGGEISKTVAQGHLPLAGIEGVTNVRRSGG